MSRAPFWLTLCLTIVLGAVVGPSAPTTAQSNSARLLRAFNVPGMNDVKFPDVLGVNTSVYVAGSSGTRSDRRSVHTIANQPFETFGGTVDLGNADGQSDYSPTVMAVGADGAIYQVWMSAENNRIYLRRKGPGEDWGPERTVIAGGNFRVRVDVAVTTSGRIFVVWDENSRYRFRISDDGGANWSGTSLVSEDETSSRPILAAGPNDSLAIAYSTGGNNEAGETKVGIWNGNSFDITNLTADLGDYASDPTVTIAPNGLVYVAWRFVEGGIWYAERQTNGTWGKSRLVGGDKTAYGTVAIVADRENNLHLGWAGNTSGNFDVWYAFKPNGGDWQGPIMGSDDGDLDANGSIHWTVGDAAYGHFVNERFTSGGLRVRYAVFAGESSGCTGTLVLEGGAPTTRNNPFSGVITPQGCTPTQMQVTLNTPPTASTPRGPYTPNLQVTVPPDVMDSSCTQTVYVQLYEQANAAFNESATFQQSITLDPPGDVDANVVAGNPNISGQASSYTPFGTADAGFPAGAMGGDPAFTRSLQTFLSVTNNGDCSGLTSFVLGGTTTDLTNGFFQGVIGLPFPANEPPGVKNFDVVVIDAVGNAKTFPQAITYDPVDLPTAGAGRPVVNTATIANDNASAEARRSIIRTLSFSNVNVTDNLYRPGNPGSQFWGVWVANGPRNEVVSPDDSRLQWVPVKVDTPGSSFSVQWNLFNYGPGPRLDQQGNYTVYVRFLDGAGNASTDVFSTTFTLDAGYTLPTVQLPLVDAP